VLSRTCPKVPTEEQIYAFLSSDAILKIISNFFSPGFLAAIKRREATLAQLFAAIMALADHKASTANDENPDHAYAPLAHLLGIINEIAHIKL
jgi:hypothetical protein